MPGENDVTIPAEVGNEILGRIAEQYGVDLAGGGELVFPKEAEAAFNAEVDSYLQSVAEAPSRVLDNAGKLVTEGIPDTARAVAGVAEAGYDTLKRAGDISKSEPQSEIDGINELKSLGKALKEKFSGVSKDELKATGMQTAGALGGAGVGAGLAAVATAAAPVTGGLSLLLIPAGTILGAWGAGELAEELSLRKNTPATSPEKMRQLRSDIAGGVLLPPTAKRAVKLAGVVAEAAEGTISPGRLKTILASKKGVFPRRMGIGAKTTPSEQILLGQLAETEDVFIRSGVLSGAKTGRDIYDNVKAAVDGARESKKTLVSAVEDAVGSAPKGSKVPTLYYKDMGFDKLERDVARRAKTGAISADDAQAMLASLKESFEEKFQFLTTSGSKPIQKSFSELEDMVDAFYDEARAAKAFDDLAVANKISRPSVQASAAATVDFYLGAAKAVRAKMDSYLDDLAKAGVVPPETANQLKARNKFIHDMLPWQAATQRFSEEAMNGFVRRQASSLPNALTATGAGGSRTLRAMEETVAGPINSKLLRRAQDKATLAGEAEVVSELQDLAARRTGAAAPPGPVGTVVGGTMAAGTRAAKAAEDALLMPKGGPLPEGTVRPGAQALMLPSTLELFSSPENIQALIDHPELKPETKQAVKDAANGTPMEQVQALGKAKYDARNSGIFPPSGMKGVHSYVETPNQTGDFETPVLGVIADPIEGHVYMQEIQKLPTSQRAIAKTNYNKNRSVTVIPPGLAPAAPAAAAAPQDPEAEIPGEVPGSEEIEGETESLSDGTERVVHDY